MDEDDDRNASRGTARSIDIPAPPVLVGGGYQILPMQGPPHPGGSPAYGIATLTGQPLRQELSLDGAKRLLDRLVEDEARTRQEARPTRKRAPSRG